LVFASWVIDSSRDSTRKEENATSKCKKCEKWIEGEQKTQTLTILIGWSQKGLDLTLKLEPINERVCVSLQSLVLQFAFGQGGFQSSFFSQQLWFAGRKCWDLRFEISNPTFSSA
jgi:hypothetical protein